VDRAGDYRYSMFEDFASEKVRTTLPAQTIFQRYFGCPNF
jgi:hypothetical protein